MLQAFINEGVLTPEARLLKPNSLDMPHSID
jgi:hypothetical protein